jgi:endonuclease/exonuclease/phosphatase family metal-dependent hydrolase
MEPTVGEQLAVINVKLDVLIEQRADQEARLRALETARWKNVGWASGAAAAVALLAPYIQKGLGG